MRKIVFLCLFVGFTFALSACQSGDPDLIIEIIEEFDSSDINETIYEGRDFRDQYGRGDYFVGEGQNLLIVTDEDEVYIIYNVASDDGYASIEIDLTKDGDNASEIESVWITYVNYEDLVSVRYSTIWPADSVYVREGYQTIIEAVEGLSMDDIREILLELRIRELR